MNLTPSAPGGDDIGATPWDVIIIGSSFAGGACFGHLCAERPDLRVLMLDGGPRLPLTAAELDTPYRPGRDLFRFVRARRHGVQPVTVLAHGLFGGSAFTQFCLPEHPEHFQAALGDQIELDPAAIRARFDHYQDALSENREPLSDLDRLIIDASLASGLEQAEGLYLRTIEPRTFGILRRYYLDHRRATIERVFPALGDGQHIAADTHVERIIFDGERRATALECLHRGREATLRLTAGGRVVIASGVRGNPLVLQRSGIGPRALSARLGAPVVVDNPDVGEGFQERIAVQVPIFARDDSRLGHNNAFHAKMGPLNVELVKNLNTHVIELSGHWSAAPPWSYVSRSIRLSRSVGLGGLFDRLLGRWLSSYVIALNACSARGVIRANPAGAEQPFEMDYRLDETTADRARFREHLDLPLRLYHEIIARLTPTERRLNRPIQWASRGLLSGDPDRFDAFFDRSNFGTCHSVGTTGMGRVVDRDFAVRGVSGVHVAGTSTFNILPMGFPSMCNAVLGRLVAERIAAGINREAARPSA